MGKSLEGAEVAKGESGAGRTRGSGEPNAKERKKKAKEACEGVK